MTLLDTLRPWQQVVQRCLRLCSVLPRVLSEAVLLLVVAGRWRLCRHTCPLLDLDGEGSAGRVAKDLGA